MNLRTHGRVDQRIAAIPSAYRPCVRSYDGDLQVFSCVLTLDGAVQPLASVVADELAVKPQLLLATERANTEP